MRRLALTIGLLVAFGAGMGVTVALSDPCGDTQSQSQANAR
ncbi:hypothetical protein [Lichenicola sp.]